MITDITPQTTGRSVVAIASGIVASRGMLILGSIPAAAASGTQVVTGATTGGVLSITAPAAPLLRRISGV